MDTDTSGGENVSSIEVEAALHRHPAVLAVAVVALPDPFWGETPVAVIETKPGAKVHDDERLFLPVCLSSRRDTHDVPRTRLR